MWCVVWRSDTAGYELTNANSTVHLSPTGAAAGESVVCMSSSASVQCGHSVSFHLHLSDTTVSDATVYNAATESAGTEPERAADTAGWQLLLSEEDGVGLSLSDNVNMSCDNVIFYSFHGNTVFMIMIMIVTNCCYCS